MKSKERFSLVHQFFFSAVVASLGGFSAPSRADVRFEELWCSGGHGLSTRIFAAKVSGTQLSFRYESDDMHQLLEALFPEGTPAEISGLYRCMELEFKVPVSDCIPTSKNLEHVKCESENVKLKMTAKNACYAPTKTKVYQGEAENFTFVAKKTTESGKPFLTQNWKFTFDGRDEAVAFTDSYKAHFWEAEGGVVRPDCRVDDYVIAYRK